MSLAISAAPWTNENHNTTKKRISYSRKTIKNRAYPQQQNYDISPANEDRSAAELTDVSYYDHAAAELVVPTAAARTSSAILQRMASLESMENQSSDPADFSPPPAPEIQQRRAASATAARPIGMPEPATLDDIPVYVPTAPPPVSKIAAANDLGLYSSYGNTYSVPRGLEPFTAATTAAPLEDSRLMEKINYMIHLLEEQQHERTSNVIEEVILYSFLGVFIIFICDAFARTGKYHR